MLSFPLKFTRFSWIVQVQEFFKKSTKQVRKKLQAAARHFLPTKWTRGVFPQISPHESMKLGFYGTQSNLIQLFKSPSDIFVMAIDKFHSEIVSKFFFQKLTNSKFLRFLLQSWINLKVRGIMLQLIQIIVEYQIITKSHNLCINFLEM